jgi:hypothetical protein
VQDLVESGVHISTSSVDTFMPRKLFNPATNAFFGDGYSPSLGTLIPSTTTAYTTRFELERLVVLDMIAPIELIKERNTEDTRRNSRERGAALP